MRILMRIWIRLITLMRIWMWIRIMILFDVDPDPDFYLIRMWIWVRLFTWVAILYPPPHQGILLFCLILLSYRYLTSGVFSGCKLSLLKQHIFLILTSVPDGTHDILVWIRIRIRGSD
jgi:hypothetical protein